MCEAWGEFICRTYPGIGVKSSLAANSVLLTEIVSALMPILVTYFDVPQSLAQYDTRKVYRIHYKINR